MKIITIIGILIFVSGCATSTVTYLPDGGVGHSVVCSGAASTWADCDEKAGEICKAKGYTVISKEGETGGTLSSNQYGTYAGSFITRSMLIKCGPLTPRVDDGIQTKARRDINAMGAVLDNAHLVIASLNGYVLIAGQVPEEALKTKVTGVVRKVPGVRRIYNELEVGLPSSSGTRDKDSQITNEMTSWLLKSFAAKSLRVKVITENRVVYILGLVNHDVSDQIAKKASEIPGVKRVVTLYEFVD